MPFTMVEDGASRNIFGPMTPERQGRIDGGWGWSAIMRGMEKASSFEWYQQRDEYLSGFTEAGVEKILDIPPYPQLSPRDQRELDLIIAEKQAELEGFIKSMANTKENIDYLLGRDVPEERKT